MVGRLVSEGNVLAEKARCLNGLMSGLVGEGNVLSEKARRLNGLVSGQGEWVEHKDAKSVIHDGSARHVRVPGRFAYQPTLPSPKLR
ncbi:hypothetical protein [Erwinia sp. E_sp_B04_7]|uniref:hypothetical protein n=1 Tax=unclassified Erwinia TaxID=2622719 RepID=UPI0030CD210D